MSEETFDQVVVGSGAAAMAAAIAARDAGASVVMLESLERVGGSTGYSGGIAWVPNNPLMARDGVPDSPEQALEYFESTVPYDGPGTSRGRRLAFIHEGPEMVAFLERKGMRWQRAEGYADYYDDRPGGSQRGRSLCAEPFNLRELGEWGERVQRFPGPPIRFSSADLAQVMLVKATWPARKVGLRIARSVLGAKLRGRDLRGAGGALIGRLLQIALREGIDVRTDTKVTGFLVEDGRVAGVEVQNGREASRIRARQAVIMGSGGFAHNERIRDALERQPSPVRWTNAPPGDTGELLEQAIGLGAATDCMDEAVWAWCSLGPGLSHPKGTLQKSGAVVPMNHHFDVSLPHCIVVDQNGERFVNEAGSYMDYGQQQYARDAATGGKAIPAWAIIESRHRRKYFWGMVAGPSPKAWFESGYMIKADTIEELASRCEIDPSGLRSTVDRVNGFCHTGVDEDYGRGGRAFDRYHGDPNVKPNPNLGTIEKAPFYAVRIYPGDVGTYGGLVTDEHARVLRDDGSVIDGLYATGSGTASVCGRSYIGAGASIGPTLAFGYIAGRHAAG